MRSWLRRQTESPGVFRTRGSPWSLSMPLFGDFLSGDLVWGYGISATDCLAIRSESHSCTSAVFRDHRYINCHAEIIIGRADKTAGDGNRLTDVTGDRNAYQVAAADRPVRWVVGNPAGTWQIDISPCVCRPSACYRRGVTVRRRIVEISRHDACPKAKAAGRFDQQDGEVAARAPATVECLNGGLCPLRFSVLI